LNFELGAGRLLVLGLGGSWTGWEARFQREDWSMDRQRLHVFYSGRVQGVGFRYTAKALAHGFEVTGTVRNLPDGRVELLAEGDRPELEAFREAIHNSELSHFIRDEQTSWGAAKNEFRGFDIVR
jgi:acylphosphatase